MEIKFVTGEAAALVGRSLVVTDLHIGIEYEFWERGIKLPSQTEKMKSRIESLIKETNAERLVILGDVKHKVPGMSFQERKEVPEFLDHFAKKTEVHVIPGNHDGDLKKIVSRKIKIHPAKGFMEGGVYFTHGHTNPVKQFLKAEYILSGHVQPQIEFKSKLGYVWREKAWVRSGEGPELIILPGFNEFSGGLSLNKKDKTLRDEKSSPIAKLANMEKARIYLLDGTFLGELGNL
jgi:putative SbcD/Mre11-related phosphoesterase